MALETVKRLLEDLNTNGINYCHWKSNEHIEAAINGDTDLDILFDQQQENKVIEILTRNNFHLFEAVWYRKYKGIVDYIGFDKAMGKIIHVHTHFFLDIGEVGIKSYRIPWEQMILETRVFIEGPNIYKSSAEMEFLLLVVRTAFKHDALDSRSNLSIVKHFKAEAGWLYDQVDPEKLLCLSEKLLGNDTTKIIEQIWLSKGYHEKQFLSLKVQLKIYFSRHRILSAQRVNYLKTVRFVKRIQQKLAIMLKLPVRSFKRSLPHQGIVVCVMGSDGAGKSTQTKEVTRELAKKVDVLFMYMGSGDGKKSIQRKIIERCIQLGSRLGTPKKPRTKNTSLGNDNDDKKDISRFSIPKQVILSLKAVSLAFEKRSRLKRINRERNRGGIIICDRYPQTTTLGYNDGPKLYTNLKSRNILLRYLAKYEYQCYQLANQIYPDLVIKLTGSLDVLHARRPEMSREEINKKQNGIIDLEFKSPTVTINLDIDRPIYEIKGAILDTLSHQINNINK